MTMNKYLSIITLNVNGLNVPIKRHRVAEWIREQTLAGVTLNAGLQNRGGWFHSQSRAHAWVAGQAPSRGCGRGNSTFDVSFSPSLPFFKKS